MAAFLAAKFEVWAEAAVVQHVEGVAAYRKDLASFDHMMFIQNKPLGVVRDAAVVRHGRPRLAGRALP